VRLSQLARYASREPDLVAIPVDDQEPEDEEDTQVLPDSLDPLEISGGSNSSSIAHHVKDHIR